MSEHTVVDVCSGAGCFSEGFKQAGFKILLGVDVWETATQSYKSNHGNSLLFDITNPQILDLLPNADVYIGSPPCQDWSEGKAEKRNFDTTIINAFLNIVKHKKPKYWVWECAPATNKLDNSPILNALDYGVPQIRKRAFHANFSLPPPKTQGCSVNKLFGWTESKVLYNHRSLNENAYSPIYLSNRPARTAVTWPIRIYKEEPFTVEMMKAVQTIPKEYILCGNKADQYKQIGNAVPPRQAFHIATHLKSIINGTIKQPQKSNFSKMFG